MQSATGGNTQSYGTKYFFDQRGVLSPIAFFTFLKKLPLGKSSGLR
jgi:hypothetical protein